MRKNVLLTTEDIAKHCCVSHETVENWIKTGKLNAYTTPGRHHRIRVEDIHDFLQRYGLPPLDEPPLQKRKILVVDDHAGLVDCIVRFFSMTSDYEMAAAADGYEAGFLMAKFCPDLVVLDLIRPYRDGFHVCKKIKSNPNTSHVMVLVMTAYPEKGNIERAMECGADAWLVKPFGMDALKQKVDELFEKQGRKAYRKVI